MHQQPSNPKPHGEELSCNLHHQLHNTKSIDEHSTASIDTQPLPFDSHNDNKHDYGYLTPDEFGIFRDPEGNARAMDGRILQVSKEDIADILSMANGPDNLFFKQREDPEYPKMIADTDYEIVCRREPYFKYTYQLGDAKLINGNTSASIDKEEKDKYGAYRDMYGRPRSIKEKVIPVSTIHIRDILQRASLCKPSFLCLPEHREGFTQATPSDPNPYSRAEMDERLKDIYTVQYDS
ncbi:hypothetical protein Bca101_009983 [Brassica carinata]